MSKADEADYDNVKENTTLTDFLGIETISQNILVLYDLLSHQILLSTV